MHIQMLVLMTGDPWIRGCITLIATVYVWVVGREIDTSDSRTKDRQSR
jgi:hypothetical protein